jgi:hypothetical protein
MTLMFFIHFSDAPGCPAKFEFSFEDLQFDFAFVLTPPPSPQGGTVAGGLPTIGSHVEYRLCIFLGVPQIQTKDLYCVTLQ